jgi:hypothetical protein
MARVDLLHYREQKDRHASLRVKYKTVCLTPDLLFLCSPDESLSGEWTMCFIPCPAPHLPASTGGQSTFHADSPDQLLFWTRINELKY